ncbi:MAG: hypothetical protein ABIQ18_35485 [Umezawaea sp.]
MRPCPSANASVARPSSVTSIRSSPPSTSTTSTQRAGAACRITFVSASCTIRYADRSIPSGRPATPLIRASTSTPATRARSTSSSTSDNPGVGRRSTASSTVPDRSAPSRCRISASAARLAVSITWRASPASCGRTASTWLATPALTAITPMLWATTSCSSRAIRSRSSATARAVSCCAHRAANARRSCTARPTVHAIPSSATPRNAYTPLSTGDPTTRLASSTATLPRPIFAVGARHVPGRVAATQYSVKAAARKGSRTRPASAATTDTVATTPNTGTGHSRRTATGPASAAASHGRPDRPWYSAASASAARQSRATSSPGRRCRKSATGSRYWAGAPATSSWGMTSHGWISGLPDRPRDRCAPPVLHRRLVG